MTPRGLAAFFGAMRRRYRGRLWLLLAVIAVAGLLEGMTMTLILPLLGLIGIDGGDGGRLGAALDEIFATLDLEPTAGPVIGLLALMLVLQNGTYLLQGRLAARMQNGYATEWRQRLMRAFLGASWPWLANARDGVLINTIMSETQRVGGAFYLLVQILAASLVTTTYIGLALLASWQVTVVLLAAGATVMLLTLWIVRRGQRIGEEYSRRSEDLTAATTELIAGAKMLKATATEREALLRFDALADRIRALLVRQSFDPYLIRAAFEGVGITLLAVVVVYAATGLDAGASVIFLILALFVRLYPRLMQLQQNLQMLNVMLPALETVERLESEALAAREIEVSASGDLQVAPGPAIRFEGVTVAYGDTRVLERVSLDIPTRATIGIVGGSGAGKTTLVDSLLRLVDPIAGRILVDGRPLADLPLGAWRRAIGYVGQDTFLLDASIRDNIRWGSAAAGDTEIEAAARRAHAHDFIAALPRGYDTTVGDRGVRLSGGQRQRIGLARALLGDKVLLVLDEATSALDSESERHVLEAIAGLQGTLTIIMVAHRLSTLRQSDIICVFEGGRVVETGRWNDLASGSGRFSSYLRLQATRGGSS